MNVPQFVKDAFKSRKFRTAIGTCLLAAGAGYLKPELVDAIVVIGSVLIAGVALEGTGVKARREDAAERQQPGVTVTEVKDETAPK